MSVSGGSETYPMVLNAQFRANHIQLEVRRQIRLTLTHELGHYFGLDEEQLKDV